MNLCLFTEILIKEAEEKSQKKEEKEVSFGRRMGRAVPLILGMGTGAVAVGLAKENINKIKNPGIRMGLKWGIPAAAAAGAHFILPKVKKQIEEDIFQGKNYDKHKNS